MSDYGCEASLYENLAFRNITMERVYSAPVRVEITDDAFTRMETVRKDAPGVSYMNCTFE